MRLLRLRTRASVPSVALLLLLGPRSIAQAPNVPDETMPLLRGASVVALTNTRIIDGTGAPPREGQTLIIERGKIRAVGNSADIKIPGARTVDLKGRTVLPGLVMLHEHLGYGSDDFTHAQPFSAPRLYLAFGVTTIRTAGTDHPYVEFNLKSKIDAGQVPGPEMFITSPFFNGPGGRFLGDKIVRDPEDARRAVRYWAAEGVTSFKAYRRISRETLAAIIDEAHRLGLPVTAHLESVSCREAAELGIDNLEHAFGPCTRSTADNLGTDANGPRAQALIRLLVERKVVLTFTPIERSRPLSDRELELLHRDVREKYLHSRSGVALPPTDPGDSLRAFQARLTLAFVRAGGSLVLGSDPLCCDAYRMAGVSDHDAIKLAVKTGFTPLEVIHMATLEGAAFLGIQDRTGSIGVGKEADLLVVRGDPSAHIEDIDNVEMIFANGVAYDPQALLSRVKGMVGWQ
jgi:imidazolonepropionase-like amidohydrolase